MPGRLALLAFVAMLPLPATGWAVIKPQSSPADIFKQVETIGAGRFVKQNNTFKLMGKIEWIKGVDNDLQSLVFSADAAPTFAKSLEQSRGSVLIVAANVNGTTQTFLLAGNEWFELRREKAGEIHRNDTINWFFGAGVDVLLPALRYAAAHPTAKFPTGVSEKWRQVSSLKVGFQPERMHAFYHHESNTDRLIIANESQVVEVAWRGDQKIALLASDDKRRQGQLDRNMARIEALKLLDDAASDQPFGDITTLAFCDFNRDGEIEFLTAGASGIQWLVGNRKVGYTNQLYACGFDFSKLTGVTELLVADRDGDNFEDIVALFADKPPLVFRNMGFGCFQPVQNWAAELEGEFIAATGAVVFERKSPGPRIALATPDKSIVVLSPLVEWPGSVVTVTLPPDSKRLIQIEATDNRRSLGAKVLSANQAVRFTKVNKGPLDIIWKDTHGKERKKRVIVLRPTALELPDE